MKSTQYSFNQSTWILNWALVLGLLTITPAHSQVNPDNTLPAPSIVNSRGNQIEITGGTQSGRNLFHSFRDFSVPNRRIASFQQIDPSVENIFSRITGSSVSRINGMIEALNRDGSVSGANLFLINPNGIIFGPNASLNIGGSFLATTANSIQFADGTQFSAVNPQTNPLLTISVPVGLQFGHSPGRIVNRSYVDFNTNTPLLDNAGNPLPEPFNDLVNNPYEGLRVAPNRTIALLGGNVQFPEGELTAPAGHIEVASLAGSGLVRLTQVDEGWRFNYGGQQQFGRIQLSNADLNVSGDRAGSIQLRGEHIDMSNPFGNSSIRAYTYNGNGGTVVIQGTYLTVRNDLLSANTYGSGRGGNIRITVDQMLLANGGQIEANTYANGEGGNILIRASEFVRIRDILRQNDGQPVRSGGPPSPSGVFARVACQSEAACKQTTGQGGNIFIATNSLQLVDGGQLSSDTCLTDKTKKLENG
nr:MAG: filamentous hemagglutinin N-terminal domain-containing protein [Leptolyngbya sp. IPPAS B-1204]